MNGDTHNSFNTLLAGAVAGLVVDVTLFPIDTMKTRLQSELGFSKSGGFGGIYKGLAPAAAGSAPTAALFFGTYENLKNCFSTLFCCSKNSPYIHMASASGAELIACLIRVPVEVAKQRRQAFNVKRPELTAWQILWNAYKSEGLRNGIYRGFGSTIAREIPFSLIQFPLWEYLKLQWQPVTGINSTPFTVALCGAAAGAFSAGLTTPLDVVKTRVMLAEHNSYTNVLSIPQILFSIYKQNGIKSLFAGFIPRVIWIGSGGALFFGSYDLMSRLLQTNNSCSIIN